MTSPDRESTFAAYLAQVYVARHGYRYGTIPEAAALAEAYDFLLTYSDAYSFKIVCIVDREADPGRRFLLSRPELETIGKPCGAYTASVDFAKMAVEIDVIEVAPSPPHGADIERLNACTDSFWFTKVRLSAWHLVPSAGSIWTNSPLGGYLRNRRQLHDLMRQPRLPEEELRALTPVRPWVFPWATLALLAVLTAIFAAQQHFGIGPGGSGMAPSITTLVAMGGLNRKMVVESGEWHRVLTAAMLHGNLVHLLSNGIALFFTGRFLERLVGRWWFLALFGFGTVGGSLASLAINPANIVSVGASGAIMCQMAAAFVFTYRLPHGSERTGAQVLLMRVLIPALIPLASRGHVDFAAHAGGGVTGMLVGMAVLQAWPRDEIMPRLAELAAGCAAIGIVAFVMAFGAVVANYPPYTVAVLLIPPEQLPKTDVAARAQVKDLVARYPRDPRGHLMQAKLSMEGNDLDRAETELRTGLTEQDILRDAFPPELEWQLRTSLALIRLHKNDVAEARNLAVPVCTSAKQTPMREALGRARLCE